ncbi:MAG: serine/threonine-protein kinase, partial [Myxococcota bacterium]|nr:serine/threonine-protein kinase [Myxococcota bacterium]
SGGMGSVYRGIQLSVDLDVAIKVMRFTADMSEAARRQLTERFHLEARATSHLKDPHIVEVHKFGETDDGLLYLVLELIDGTSLADIIKAEAPLPSSRAARIGAQIARACAAAHAKMVIHRDLKPRNVMLYETASGAEHVKVLDFGIASIVDPTAGAPSSTADTFELTRQGQLLGSPRYMAPEQWQGEQVMAATDLYALGCVIYEMLTGRFPYEDAGSLASLKSAHLDAPELALPDDLPLTASSRAAWNTLLCRLMNKRASARMSSATEAVEALEALVALGDLVEPGEAPPLCLHVAKRDQWPESAEVPTLCIPRDLTGGAALAALDRGLGAFEVEGPEGPPEHAWVGYQAPMDDLLAVWLFTDGSAHRESSAARTLAEYTKLCRKGLSAEDVPLPVRPRCVYEELKRPYYARLDDPEAMSALWAEVTGLFEHLVAGIAAGAMP